MTTTGNPELAGICVKCNCQMYAGLTHQCITTAVNAWIGKRFIIPVGKVWPIEHGWESPSFWPYNGRN